MALGLNITEISFTTSNGTEIFDFGGNFFEIDQQGLSLTISNIPESVLYHIWQNINRNKEILRETFGSINPELISAYSKKIASVDNFARSIKNEFLSLSEYNNNPDFFILLYPIFSMLVEYRVHYGFLTYIERTPEYVRNANKDYIAYLKGTAKDTIKHPIKKLLKQQPSESELLYQTLEEISSYLCNSQFLILPFSQTNIDYYYRAMLSYADAVLSNIKTILYLKTQLKVYLNKLSNGEINSFEDCPDWMRNAYFSGKDHFNVLSLSQAVAIEQHDLIQTHKYLRVCKLCGRMFYANTANTLYCDVINSDFNGKTCREIGHKETPASKSPLYQDYYNAQKVYRNWINNNKRKYPAVFTGEVLAEAEKIYKKWNTKALSAVCDFDNSNLSKADAMAVIELPMIEERSPQLYRFKHK